MCTCHCAASQYPRRSEKSEGILSLFLSVSLGLARCRLFSADRIPTMSIVNILTRLVPASGIPYNHILSVLFFFSLRKLIVLFMNSAKTEERSDFFFSSHFSFSRFVFFQLEKRKTVRRGGRLGIFKHSMNKQSVKYTPNNSANGQKYESWIRSG